MKNITLTLLSIFLCLFFTKTYAQAKPNIDVIGNGIVIPDGDTTPSTTDWTDFGSVAVVAGVQSYTFTITNTGSANLILSPPSPFAIISGATADFTITTIPASTIGMGASTTFIVTFDPTSVGVKTATITIDTNVNGQKSSYTFDIQGLGTAPEMNVTGNATTIADGDTTPTTTDWTDFGIVGTGSNFSRIFTIQNTGNANLNLTGSSPYVVISGANAADFSVTVIPTTPITSSGSTTFTIRFSPTVAGVKNATLTIANNDSDENPYNFDIQGTAVVPAPEINIQGNGVSIASGDITPVVTDDTDFGSVNEAGGTNPNTFTIQNTGITALNLTGSSPYVVISGANAADFTLTANPSTPIAAGNNTTFTITFNPSGLGLRTATVSIANNDSDENPYTFNIQGTGVDACGGYVTTFPYTESFETGLGLWQQGTADTMDWTRLSGTTPTASTGPPYASTGSYYLYTEATGFTSKTANLYSPCFDLTGVTNPRFTIFYHMYGSNMGTLNVHLSTDSGATYPVNLMPIDSSTGSPLTLTGQIQGQSTSSWIPISFDLSAYVGQIVKIRIQGLTGSGDRSDIAIDNISFTTKANPTVAPGGITTGLATWLKANDGLGYSDGSPVLNWQDKGLGSDVRPQIPAQAPTYRENVSKNVNFNPVIEFDNTFATFVLDGDYSHDNPSTEFLTGDYGFYTRDMFIVLIPDDTPINNSFGFFDIYCSDAHLNVNSTDATGLGAGDFTGRVNNEILCYAHDSYTNGQSPPDGYASAEIGTGSSYTNIGIINARNNSTNTQQELYYNARNIGNTQNDIPEYLNESDKRFWIGRSEGWEASLNARVAEVITYKSRKVDTDLTQERNRIQSYLAVKYGITLGVNGTSQDYVNSDGTVIWDVNTGVPTDDVFNYDIAGIGRDDASGLYQKQSRSVNNASDGNGRTQGVLTMGINKIYDTNKLNTNTLTNKQFLMWGNDGVNLNNPAVVVDVDMSSSISPAIPGGTWVQFNAIARTWKVVENGGDIPSVEVQVLKNAIRTATPPDGRYLMFISDTPNFDPTADYRVMTEDVNELGEDIVTTDYDFDGTKYITFGWAPEVVYERSIYFNGSTDYVDMEDALDLNPTEFTISAWAMRDSGSEDTSILSKRDAAYTEGYDFKINSTGRFEVSWKNGSTQTITSDVVIPVGEWHHLAVIYKSGKATLYIDGVEDKNLTLAAPTVTAQSFYIGAAGKNSPTAFFKGNIDEVRVWNKGLSEAQLRYIMNQEIEDNTSFVSGSYFVSRNINPTKNEVATLPWSDLAGYYPMSTYTYTNTKDESGNGHQGALRHLRTVDRQTAPLPYISNQDGDWDTNTTWLNGTKQTIPGSAALADNTITVDWNIVETSHNITMDNTSLPAGKNGNRTVLGLINDSNTITIDGDNTSKVGYGLTITHYLNLDGKIDLEGESQLIQTLNSDLEITSSGTIEKDQQGTKDLFTYNYWSSPVGISNIISNNNSYTVPNVLKDGTNSASPALITFLTSGYNGAIGTPLKIADYWIWKYSNQPTNNYSAWQHVRSSGSIAAGEGFTMKGVANTNGNISQEQNYVLRGKPNNGDITLTLSANNDYLVGNPYPSALDADEFIKDNISHLETNGRNTSGNVINGALYFWDHFASGTHVLAEYEGGYATYTLMGGAPAVCTDTRINATGFPGTKEPERYIPVGQGFFVSSVLDTGLAGLAQPIVGGSILFKNSQRVFKKEAVTGSNSGSVFFRTNSESSKGTNSVGKTAEIIDNRPKIRLMFDSPEGYHRQLLVGVDENASNDFDLGYDALINETNKADMYWNFVNNKFIIQAVNNFDEDQILPLGVKTSIEGIATIRIESLENIDNDKNIYIHDKETNTYHNLKDSNFEFQIPAGEYLDKYEITFSDLGPISESLGISENELNALTVYYSNESGSIVLLNPNLTKIKHIELLNILGQSIKTIDRIELKQVSEFKIKNLSSGTYVLKMHTVSGSVSKKVLVK